MTKYTLSKNNEKISVGIIGLGYVGLPLLIRFSKSNFKTIGLDIDKNKIKKLKNGESYLSHISSKTINEALINNVKFSSNFKNILNVNVIIICVPTPLGIHNEPDLSFIEQTLLSIEPYIVENQIIVLESTTYPGTTDEIVVPFVVANKSSNKKLTIGKNYFVGYSPEREDPGNDKYSTKNIPKIVSGVTNNCLNIVNDLYSRVIDATVPVSSPKVAEMTKILENIYRSVNIGLVNELKMITDKMNIDIHEVIKAASTKPFGFTPYYPGPGLGGHCIPIDPFYLTWKAKEFGVNARFIELAGEINTYMPYYVLNKTIEALNSASKSIKDSKILILGLAYKKNIDDTRESPSFAIIDFLIKNGALIKYSDPYINSFPKKRKYDFKIERVQISPKTLKEFDLVMLCTDHDAFDYKMIIQNSKLLVDTRGKYKNYKNLIKA